MNGSMDGPKFVEELNQFLGDVEGEDNTAIDSKMVPCVWSKIMQQDSHLEELFPQMGGYEKNIKA